MAWQNFYSRPGNAFGLKGTYYGKAGHRGKDYKADAGTPTPAYAAGRVALIKRSAALGKCVVIQAHDGYYDGYAHQRDDVAVKLGQLVAAGQTLSYVAGSGDMPGTAWAGSHLHTTRSKSVNGIFWGTVFDPTPAINAALHPVAAVLASHLSPLWKFNLPSLSGRIRVQRAMKNRKPPRYLGLTLGLFNKATIMGVQSTLRGVGYSGAIDGVAGAKTCYYVQAYAKKFGSYTGKLDSILGPNSWAGFALGLERP